MFHFSQPLMYINLLEKLVSLARTVQTFVSRSAG